MNITGTPNNDTLIGTTASDSITGLGGDDQLLGNGGSDTLDGGDGNDFFNPGIDNDTVIGGLGNDFLYINYSQINSALAVNETLTGAQIKQVTDVEYYEIYGSQINDAITGGVGDDNIQGNQGNDTLNGNAGNDYLADGAGNDIINGNEGNDYLVSNEGNDLLNGGDGNDYFDLGKGNDTVIGGQGDDILSIDYSQFYTALAVNETLAGANVKQVTEIEYYNLFGSKLNDALRGGINGDNLDGREGNDTLNGDAGDDYLIGKEGSDYLNGGEGHDTLVGGKGDDIYVVDSLDDRVNETSNTDKDTILSSITLKLSNYAKVENLTLIGTSNLDGTGHGGNNLIKGQNGDNRLDGSAGSDTLIGGLGNDTYVVDMTTDTLIEDNNQGIDNVESNITFDLNTTVNIENLTLTGTSNINATGNAANNLITGNNGANNINGGAGNDTLNGLAGIDTLAGGDGNDIYIVSNSNNLFNEAGNGGKDTIQSDVSFALNTVNNIENLTLTGIININATGNGGNNVITGQDGDNRLDGRVGIDSLIGGLGNDTYVVDTTTDSITEDANGGIDTIESNITFNLANIANLENLTLTGQDNINATGNTLNNLITGNNGANDINGGAGNDTLNGLAGIDTLAGGDGNDIYIVSNSNNLFNESANGGKDTIQSDVSFALNTVNYIENLTLTGTSNINATGNGGNNVITGQDGDNRLDGRLGIDTLTGGAGNDIYIFQFGQSLVSAPDRISDLAIGSDQIDLLSSTGVSLASPNNFTRATDSTETNLSNLVNQVFIDANGVDVGNQALDVNSAALVTVTSGAITGTYLIINDEIAGFQSNLDSVININGYTGTLPNLGNIPVNTFFV